MPNTTYDADADILYVKLLDDGNVARQTFLDDLRIIDHSEDGSVVGIEFIDASGGVDLAEVPFAEQVEELIGHSGHSFKLLV